MGAIRLRQHDPLVHNEHVHTRLSPTRSQPGADRETDLCTGSDQVASTRGTEAETIRYQPSRGQCRYTWRQRLRPE